MAKKKKKAKRNAYKQMTDHHIIPSSRGGPSNLENIAKIIGRDHQFYHALFYNKTPTEIIDYLVKDCWNGQWDYVKQAYDERNKY